MNSGLAAVLFDMDGTLVDTEIVWDVGLDELARRYGGALSGPAREEMVGTSMASSLRILHEDIAQPWRDTSDSLAWLEQRMTELFAVGLAWRPGAQRLLAEVRASGIPTALVTATKRPLVEVAFRTIGSANFDVVVCGDEVDESKPHPAPYRTAAALLGTDPKHCVAIEDSPTGLASARAAGCVVVAVPCKVPIPAEPGLTIVDSLDQLDVPSLRSLVAGSPAQIPG